MNRNFAMLTAALFLSACGGAADQAAKNSSATANGRPAASNNAANTAASVDQTPGSANAADPADPAKAVTNANAVNSGENPLTAGRNKKIEAMRQAGRDPNLPKPEIETVLRQSTRPAPENSEFSVALLDILVERRTFLKHPILAKVEKTSNGTSKTAKVFLKDGRVIDLPGDSIPSLSTLASSSILKAAGIASPAPQQTDTKVRAANKN